MGEGPESTDDAVRIDTTVAHSARIWDYWTGGKDHYEADRAAGEKVREVFPGMPTLARVGRHFIGRVVRHLAGEVGVSQFLDIGTGLPTVDNTHEVAQRALPAARVVYVDNDPLVLAHAAALLSSSPEGATCYVEGDVREPGEILDAAASLLDFDEPVAVMLMGVLAHVPDYAQAQGIVRRVVDALPSGSYVAVRDGTDTDPQYVQALEGYNRSGSVPYQLRTPDQVAAFLDGLDVVEPGVVPCPEWRPEAPGWDGQGHIPLYGGLGRKP